MHLHSTRSTELQASVSAALLRGLAPDGGLYVPPGIPRRALSDFDDAETHVEIAHTLLAPWFVGDPLADQLAAICTEAFTFDTPLVALDDHTQVLELFHGPTAAFKDYGARFLAGCMSRLNAGASKPLTILVATSGDTGGAVASAFDGKPNVEVVVLYPDGRVSARQAHQLGCWSDNVRTLAVDADFDTCQALVKQGFGDPALRDALRLSSANSINIGRVLPQMTYYASSALTHQRRTGQALNIIVPTGNVGNVLACLWAKASGMPIGKVHIATNANTTIPSYLETGTWSPSPTVATLANAMDVSRPSNWERIQFCFPTLAAQRAQFTASSVDDATIQRTIVEIDQRHGYVACPHTACGLHARTQLDGDWAVAATAHPAKFDTVVEPLLGRSIAVPPALAELLERPSRATTLSADYDAFFRAAVG